MKKLAHEWNLTIDEEFASVNRKLSPEEQSLLETDLESGGCRDDLVIWRHEGKRILLDGHYRYRACQTLGVPFGVIALAVASRDEALAWIKTNQRSRRNCTAEEISYFRGKRLESEKGAHGGERASGQSDHLQQRGDSSGHNDHLKTRERIAAETGVSPRTVERDAAFARAADTVAENAGTHEALAAILAGDLGTKKDIERLASLPAEEQRRAVSGGKQAVKQAASRLGREKKSAKSGLQAVKQAFLSLSEDDRMAFLDWVDREHFPHESAVA